MIGVIELRAAAIVDDEFCYRVHRAAMRDYVDAVWGWDELAQRDYHRRGFDRARTRIITVDGEDAGVLIVDHRPDEIYVSRIELQPDHQGKGVGGHLIRQLLDEAALRSHAVVLDVLIVNPRAHRLYRRLGFREVGRHGADDVKIRMRAEPIVR